MEQLENEQTVRATQAAEAENNDKGVSAEDVSLGKFKDVNALLNAYNSLQSEFTKRCQKLKELEGRSEGETTGNKDFSCQTAETTDAKPAGITDDDKKEIIKDYLKQLLGAKQSAILMDGRGVGVKTPQNRPRSVREAGKFAEEIFKS